MTVLAWVRFAVELALDLATGRLERPAPAPKPEAPGIPHREVERIRRAQLGHMFQDAAGRVWCRGPDAPHPRCRRCRPN